MTPARVLVVDDDEAIRTALARELSVAGYDVITARDGEEGRRALEKDHPDLLLTDLAMPKVDGFALIRSAREIDGPRRGPKLAPTLAILVLSVRGDEEDKIRALDLGADDFVTKPFSLKELLARVRAQLRRRSVASAPEVLRFPGLTLDRTRRVVEVEGQPVHLTPTELSILDLLASRAGKPVTIRQIIGAVWQGAPATSSDTVRVHVGSLRRKIEPDPANPRYLATEPWVGYRFLAEPIDDE